MRLVSVSDLQPLSVHLADVAVVAFAELVHAPDQLIALVCQISEFVVHCRFVVSVLRLCIPECFKLVGEFSDAPLCRVVVVLESSEVIGFPYQVGVDRLSVSLNL